MHGIRESPLGHRLMKVEVRLLALLSGWTTINLNPQPLNGLITHGNVWLGSRPERYTSIESQFLSLKAKPLLKGLDISKSLNILITSVETIFPDSYRKKFILLKVVGYTAEQHRRSSRQPLKQAAGRFNLRMRIVQILFAPLMRIIDSIADGDFYVQFIAVDKDLRGDGVGSVLMDSAEERTRASGSTRLSLDVSAENEGARRFYECRRMTVESQWPKRLAMPGLRFYRMTKGLWTFNNYRLWWHIWKWSSLLAGFWQYSFNASYTLQGVSIIPVALGLLRTYYDADTERIMRFPVLFLFFIIPLPGAANEAGAMLKAGDWAPIGGLEAAQKTCRATPLHLPYRWPLPWSRATRYCSKMTNRILD